jgi:DNA processing protein
MVNAWTASAIDLRSISGLSAEICDKFVAQRKNIDPQECLANLKSSGVRALPYSHPLYPPRFKHISSPPAVLYIKGNLNIEDLDASLSIVGTRKPTAYGKQCAQEFASKLAAAKIIIVSGMAYGIDSIAHQAALDAGGATIAILGCGPDYCYPQQAQALYEQICYGEKGLVMSEYPPGTKPEKFRFPDRNRLISGISKGTLVVEGEVTSGSLITADCANEQGRIVCAIPGRIDSRMSAGPLKLLKSSAHVVTSPEDVLDTLNWATRKVDDGGPAIVELFGRERDLYEMLASEPVHFDNLSERTGMPAGELSASLTMLELAGVITRHPGDWYSRDERR